ncbi:DUF2218 domain-containing protein [Arvimicrobium flavum]|uniref:DUF2218 domain-containing protein n=1 Tax=Arvimicrobium flavum TaxID=3393320 RepID=UPI00237BE9AB|nr:DUF2218 domain-containing protein [Mesorhizobium shangrilense]
MIETKANVATASGVKYVQQLCKHFGHKIPTTFADGHGECQFDVGRAVMDADDKGMTIRVSAADAPGNQRLQHVIESHLERFAFRENLLPLIWTPLDNS